MGLADRSIARFAWVVMLPVVMYAGCGDDSSGPANNTPPVTQETAQQQAAAAMVFIDGFVNSIDNVLLGDFTGGLGGVEAVRRVSAAYSDFSRDDICLADPPCSDAAYTNGAWTAACSSTSDQCLFNASVFVQFKDAAGNAQQKPDDATDKVTYNTDFLVDVYVTAPPGRAVDYLDFFIELNFDMTVDAIQSATWQANGSGNMDFNISAQQGEQTSSSVGNVGWSFDLDVPAYGAGCPFGTVNLTVGQYTATVVYGDTGEYTLTIYEGGNQVHQETGVSDCGA
jgi:hypothetical protein